MSTLSVQKLVKSYQGRQVVKSVSLELHSGEVVGLLGPNGAGKTTLFYMVVGLVESEQGAICLDDQDITRYPVHIRARLGLGYLPQEASVFRKLSVADNILAILQTRSDLDGVKTQQMLGDLLRELHIEQLQDTLGMSLSGGERRRVEIARALATEPKFILLDEPFAGVDPISVVDIQLIIKHLSERNIGVLITDHNVRETLGICGRAYIINAGKVICAGTPAEIIRDNHVKDVYLGRDFKM